MNRNECSIYVSHISSNTNEDDLISLFSKFGTIESYTFFSKTSQRNSAAAIITYGLGIDVNSIIRRCQRIKFNDRTLSIRRVLPPTRPAYERFMLSNELVISLDCPTDDSEFNQTNVRKYFSKYGTITSCHIIIPDQTFLLGFIQSDSVDCAILDEPHFHNDNQLIVRKYISPSRIDQYFTDIIRFDQDNKKMNISISEKFRRKKDVIEAAEFGHNIQLNLIKNWYEEKKKMCNKMGNDEMMKLIIQLRKRCDDMNKEIEKLEKKNSFSKLMIEQTQQIKYNITDLYKRKIENERNRVKQLKEAIDLLNII
ncbi:unnamed protein product [Rotaria magnacalcarata]|uniref:RRM domain-containing protein n=1 Tax=Rotaria magnacalcarata TaxID=392030 RepID=A0A816RV11_9BILA|nr:unnamed protein product [Rotaria magnacalcarata]CAF1601470.1 unnamed protein product [Rotaria magnacalcarata]CAF1970076.1 unnamed protein product [Rotaria magnacalcarata]CAF2079952.1 unnamed protein product [Rotaria magnacalcarata]CAF2115308.1 unnamed protein product [Rotaria magnacalcarata]